MKQDTTPSKYRILSVPTDGCCPSHLSQVYATEDEALDAVERMLRRGEIKDYKLVPEGPAK